MPAGVLREAAGRSWILHARALVSDTHERDRGLPIQRRATITELAAQPTPNLIRRALASLKDRYSGADPRWLGVFRVGLGVLLCVEVLRRWYYARDFYTNEGFLPNHYSLFAPMGRNVFSIYHAFSTYGEVSVAFALTLVVFVLFTLGYRTRLFHVLSAVCITSLNARNIFVENGGTVVTCIITVFSMFLPLGRRFSIDALLESWRQVHERTPEELNDRAHPERTTARVHSVAMLLFILQWSAIYFFNTVHKNGVGWKEGTAIHYFLEQDRIVTPFAVWLRGVAPPSLLAYMTWGTLVLEGSLALLILLPVWQVWARRMVLVGVWGLHGMIAALSNLGPFSYVMSLFPLLLLSARDWQLVTRWFGRASRARVVVFDGTSAASLAACRLLKRLDPFDRLTFVDAREPECLPANARERARTIALATVHPRSGDLLVDGRGLFEAVRVLPLGFVLAWIRFPGIAGLVDAMLRKWSERRKEIASWIGLPDPEASPPAAATPSALRLEARHSLAFLREAAAAVLLVAMVGQITVSNSFVPRALHMKRPEWMIELIEYPRLLQGWSMFAPEPPFEDGRIVVDGRTADGRKLDPFTGKPPEFDPHAPKGYGHEQFICDYHNRIRFPGHESNRQHLRQWLLEQHRIHKRPANRLVAFDVWWVEDKSPPPGSHHGEALPPQKLLSYGRIEDSGAKAWLPNNGEPPLPREPIPLLGP